MPANVSFFTFLNRSLRPTFIGMNIAFLAALGLGLIELPALAWKGDWSSLPGAVSLLFVGALLYAIAFNLFFFLARVTAALVSHLDRFWPALVPGLVTFLLLGEPMARRLLIYFEPADSAGAVLLGGLFILLALGLCFLILHVFPLLRNINSSMMLFAALAARLIVLPLENMLTAESWLSFLAFAAMLMALGGGCYAVLQIRFLQHLAPLHDSPSVPDIARRAAWFIAVCAGAVLFYVIALSESRPAGIDFALYVMAACGLVLALHWSLTALSLNRMHAAADPLPLLRDSEPRWFLGAVTTLTLAALGFSLSIFPNYGAARDIAARGVLSHEVLTLSGLTFDGDGDGNSRWPGGDPDDRDPCVRLDLRGHCPAPTAKAPGGLRNNGPRLKAGRSGPRHAGVLVTIAGKNYARADVISLLKGMGLSHRPLRLFLPGKTPDRALRAIFQDLDGLEERRGLIRPSIFSRYALRGVRTVCGGYDGGVGYLSTEARARLDRGCQVHVPLPMTAKRPDLATTMAIMLKKKRYYRERYSLIWIHHDFGGGRETKTSPGDMRDLARALGKLPENTPAALIFMGHGAYADAFLIAARKKAKTTRNAKPPGDIDGTTNAGRGTPVASLREIMNGMGMPWLRLEPAKVRRVGTGDPIRPAWFGAFARGLGDERSFHTFAPRADGIQSFDGITGARW